VTFTPGAAFAAGATYTATAAGAKDLAGNTLAAPRTWSFTTSGTGVCPCTIWESTSAPATPDSGDASSVELGVKFRADVNGYVYGLRFYKSAANTGTHRGTLWSSTGTQLATAAFTGETASGWQSVTFSSPVAVTAGTTYVASYLAPNGHYAATGNAFNIGAVDNPPLHALANGTDGGNGVYLYGAGGFPNQTYAATNYWVDVRFDTTAPPDTTPPAVSTRSPVPGATSVPASAVVQATFTEALQPATVTMTVSSPSGAVAGTVGVDGTGRTVTFNPTAALAASTVYTVSLSGAKDAAGNTMTTLTWSFTTAAAASGSCPCSVWSESAVPASTSVNDPSAVSLGVKVRTTVNGTITGIRFYKGAGNTGTHTGSLWTTAGTRLATGTFTGESSSGWQQLTFATPVAVTAGTTYVASYFAPNGNYAANSSFFTSAVTNGPLTALASGTDGGNGVYAYNGDIFPTNTYNTSNYWVDVVFTPTS
jgi:hypothetical protein